MKTVFRNCAIVLAACQLLDGLTTYIGLSSGCASEANPAALFLFDRLGVLGTIIMVKIAALAMIFGIYRNARHNLTIGKVGVFIAITALFVYTVINNIRFLFH